MISYELMEEISDALKRIKDKKSKKGDCVNRTPSVEKPTEAHKSDRKNKNKNQSELDGE